MVAPRLLDASCGDEVSEDFVVGKTMHARLAERRDLVQTERWAVLARSIEHTSDRVTRILGDSDSIAAQRLIARLQALRLHLSENEYSRTRLDAAVAMVGDIAGSLAQLVLETGMVETRLTTKPPNDRNGPP